MNLLVVGMSHRTAAVPVLERLAMNGGEAQAALAELVGLPYVDEAVVLSTCNRVEVYAAVTAFHGGLADIGGVLARRAGLPVGDLASQMYVHYEVDAVRHAFRVAAGLDSMVVGEAQILGQLRDAYGVSGEQAAAGRMLHELMQQALRVGKRVHAETEIDRAGQSVVSAALAYGQGATGPVEHRPALVVGAGAMGALSLATLKRAGAGPLFVTNRSLARAERLAELHGATAVPFAELPTLLERVDVVVSATASTEPVLDAPLVAGAGRPLLVIDLALPRDVAPGVGELPGVTLVDIELLSESLSTTADAEERAAEDIVATEVESFLTWLRGADVAPTVAALRARADEVVEAELRRLAQRCPEMGDDVRSEVAHSIHRIVQRLLHQPTVRVRQLASAPGGEAYAQALRELFDLHIPSEINPAAAGEVHP
ncbi:glutamyl-tRNA reductase [Dactylosporangium sp. AC04546]|uniref:glutamyl-tRNA reductase n=1 Tax=Dactylosporangium sp. AC04546 TaxID=2862460 RepID=UPI001EDE48F7|nr:glutamyl-tRNA reductase [Dactylosporangium sp. AC04546]WVK84573.1 glutamyl-tRNA reductase [Dactylosporangium sp. AC04546]